MRDGMVTHLGRPVYVSATEPLVNDGLFVGDLWVDLLIPTLKRCTSISPVTFTDIEGGGGGGGVHVLATTSGLGTDHTVSGLTAGQFLRATGATTAAFQTIQDSDLGSGTPDSTYYLRGDRSWQILPNNYYTTVQEEGSDLTQRSKMNFIGSGITAADSGSVTNISVDGDLNAIASLSTTGHIVRTASDTMATRTMTGTSNEITVTNGSGVSGDPTFSLPATIDLSGKTTLKIPTGTAPTVSASGTLAIDTNTDNSNITHGSLVFHDGTSLRYNISIDTLPTVDGRVLTYDGTNKKFVFAAPGAPTGYQTVQEEGSNLTQRTTINFVGSGLTAADDAGNTRTNVSVASNLNALASLGSFGLVTLTGAGSTSARTITGTSNQITVTNGDGVSGNPVISTPQDINTSSSPTFANVTLGTGGALRTSTSAGNTLLLRAYDVDGTAYTTFATLTANNTPTMDLSTAVTMGGNGMYYATGTDVAVTDGGTGASDASTARTNLGVAIGSNVQAWDADLDAIAALASNGIITKTGAGTVSARTITGTTDTISVTNGNGVSGNPTITLATDPVIPGTGRLGIPVGTTAQRPGSPATGDIRVNTDLSTTEIFRGGGWESFKGTNTGDQNLFSTIAVSGQSNVVADSTSDTLTLVAGTNITITTDAGADSITINASGGGGGAPTTASYVTLGTDATLSNERVLTAGTAIGLTDAGAGSTITVAVNDAELTAIAGLTSAADKVPYFTGSGTAALADFGSLSRTILATTTQATHAGAVISGASLTAATVATDDKILIQDTSDSNNLKTVTAQSIADLASAGSGVSIGLVEMIAIGTFSL